jgi:holo-[acyl-carrier protein] synthase|tara:strand:+ start:2787 stop:3170 length:384 start_codon:yes stop_codon:yes gene_type:complete
MIQGIGIDSVDKIRVSEIFSKYGERFQEKILSHDERKEIVMKLTDSSKIRYLSNNFAGKEALSKVLGLGISEGISLKEIEILRNSKGKPYINLLGRTKEIAMSLNIQKLMISITDTQDISTAFVIGE